MNQPLIDVDRLTAGYGRETILDRVSFTVEPGEILLIVGGSGSGKTTLLKHLIGLYEPLSGAIRFSGEDLGRASPARQQAILRRVGILYQGGALFGSLTLADNVSLPLREHTTLPEPLIRAITEVKLQQVGLGGFGAYLPSELSGGMRKRAGLARALALEPDLLCFDEPSSGLDPVIAADLDNLILRLRDSQGTTMLIVTHDLASTFAIADRVIMLDGTVKGILATGRPGELRDHPDPRVRRFFRREGTTPANGGR